MSTSVYYDPGKNTAARRLIESHAESTLIEGPAGTGKTTAMLWKCHLRAARYPGSRVLLVRKTRRSLTQSALVTFETSVLNEDWRKTLQTLRLKRSHRDSYNYPNGSEIVLAGLDAPERIMSTDYDLISVFEATETLESDYEMLVTRLRHGRVPWQQIQLDCNPSAPTHWLNRRASADGMERLVSRHEDNPLLYSAADRAWTPAGRNYLRKLETLTGPRLQRLRYGRWAAAEGLVYDGFDPAIHIVPAFAVPADWRRFWSVDFGTVHPFVAQLWAVDLDGRMFMTYEIYATGKLVSDHAETMRKIAPPNAVETCVCDHQLQEQAMLRDAGYHCTPARKSDKTAGIQAVQARLRTAIDGRPRLFFVVDACRDRDESLYIAHKPICTIDEFDSYTWRKKADGSAIEETIRVGDDGMDAMRYAVTYAGESCGEPGAVYLPGREFRVMVRSKEGRASAWL